MNLPENDENAEAAMEIITVRTERNSDVIDSSGNLSPTMHGCQSTEKKKLK